ncbi:redoxin domain-containing protein [Chitinophaga sp. 30R24]|uniref:redoxin domain-containing protein n=1 Tax=Chitinophaga sp. 30R24 TaxID=3248838 RepID=UPI003B8F2042
MIKATFYLSCTVLLTAFSPVKETLPELEPGSPLPKSELTWQDISGKEISLNTAKGSNGLLVIFGGNRCPYMQRNQERIHNICALAAQNNIGVVMVNSNEAARNVGESLDEMKEFASQQQFTWYYILDKNALLADAFDANHTPECFLFDNNNWLIYKGGIDDSPGNAEAVKTRLLQNAISEMLAGKNVTTNTANSLGCNIKRRI